VIEESEKKALHEYLPYKKYIIKKDKRVKAVKK
jgi:hypothetical protein